MYKWESTAYLGIEAMGAHDGERMLLLFLCWG